MPRRGEYGDTTQHCAYCGKPETSWMWSNWRNRYCSFRCNAADTYLLNTLFLCCLIPFSFLMFMGLLNFIAGNSNFYNFNQSSVLVVSIVVWVFTGLCIYSVYIGYTTARETNIEEVYDHFEPKFKDYD